MRRTVFIGLVSVLACACNGKATKEQCGEMLDKYLDMSIASDPGLAEMSPAEARAAREMKKALRKERAELRARLDEVRD